jgi:hypothetical protein
MTSVCSCKNPLNFVRVKVVTKPNKVTKVLVKFSGTSCCDVSVDNYLTVISHVYEQNHAFVVLYDASSIGRIPMTLIHKQALFMRKYDTVSKEYLIRCAIILTSEWARASLKFLFSIKPPSCPLKTFSTQVDAKTWLRDVTEPSFYH